MITDLQLLEFLQKLAGAVRTKNGLLLSEWESQFLASFLASSRPSLWFTAGRRISTEKLWMRYGAEIQLPHPADTIAERPKLADADAGGCMYLVRLDGRQQRCNAPAEWREMSGKFRYCADHGQAVERDTRRLKNPVKLVRFA